RVQTLKQYCFNYLLRHRENIPKNITTIYEIPEIREEFVALAKRKNMVDDQFFSVFGDVFILTGANSNTTTPFLNNNPLNANSSNKQVTDGDVEMSTESNNNNNNSITTRVGNSSTTRINEIDLSGLVRITDISIQFLTKYDHLQHLNLSFCTGISNDFVKVLATNPAIQLQSINLYYTNTNDQSIQSIVNTYPNLKSLSIAGCQMITEAAIKSLSKCSSLTYLDISHNRKLTPSCTKHLAFSHLIYLNASWLGPEAKEASFYKCAKNCPHLQSLSIAASNLTDSELQKILAEAKRLTSLDISYCPQALSLDTKTYKYLANLQSLSIAGCNFKEPILRKIMEYTTNLRDLDLSHQEGTMSWTFLTYIISDAHILQHLHTLNLSHSKFDKFDVDTLLQYPSLNIYLPT
ncbi:hypothetical protein SAMD00019534_121740, partial [Acytostelium subglobosum LB1]|uniref:hypothetical protein n=1 Tax=Acytostelium subglobosum LB1 TaxID=1410327 RepID=UPI000644957D